MKTDNKKSLYESIMMAVAKEVKKALNEAAYSNNLANAAYAYVCKKFLNPEDKTFAGDTVIIKSSTPSERRHKYTIEQLKWELNKNKVDIFTPIANKVNISVEDITEKVKKAGWGEREFERGLRPYNMYFGDGTYFLIWAKKGHTDTYIADIKICD